MMEAPCRRRHRHWIHQPRHLYAGVFVWISVVGGRFLAPTLEQWLSPTEIGLALAAQTFLATALGAVGGALADSQEQQRPGSGRACVVAIGIVLGSACFLAHSFWSSYAWWHVILQCGFAVATALVFPVVDGMTIDYLKDYSDSDYGKERLYGAVTWAVTHFVLALMLDVWGFGCLYPMAIVATALILTTVYCYARVSPDLVPGRLHKRMSDVITPDDNVNEDLARLDDSNDEQETIESRISSTQLLRFILIHSFSAAAFLFCLFCLSGGQVIVDSLVFLFFEFLGSSYTLMGFTVLLTVAFEIPIFRIAGQLLERCGGPNGLLLLAAACYITRVIGYSFIPPGHTAWVLLLEPLHGVTYACAQTAMVEFVARILPDGYEATGQGLVGVFKGAGSVLGLLLGGWAEQTVGPRIMYRVSAGVVSMGCVVFSAVLWHGGPTNLGHHQPVPTKESDIELAASTTHGESDDDSDEQDRST